MEEMKGLKKVIGGGLVSLPFVILAIFIIRIYDWKVFFMIYGGVGVLYSVIILGVNLLFSEGEE